MSDRIPASGTVHWIGTGRSVGSGLRVLCEETPRVLVWGRTAEKAQRCLDSLGLAGRAETLAFSAPALTERLAPGDVVVSMLPATEHTELIRLCIDHRAHFACSSYVSPEMEELAAEAEKAGLVLLAEAGLDPGIDHLLAHALVGRAAEVVGTGPATVRFTSYCGGVPAEPNEFRYRFSWAPRGVLSALLSPARYVDGGAERTVALPWEATRTESVAGEEFEVYPNRDSLPFLAQYGFPAGWRPETFVRGTLRLSGWRDAWAGVFDVLRDGDDERIGALATDLAARYPTTDADRDRVVLVVALDVAADDGRRWSGECFLDMVGDAEETAMARCVSVPLAFGILVIVRGEAPAGLRRAAHEATESQRWLDFLREHGVSCQYTEQGG
jgi:Saccharopine dehydrogenase C-terminal domain/Saccharopine dehydrogenase NADP binding domain